MDRIHFKTWAIAICLIIAIIPSAAAVDDDYVTITGGDTEISIHIIVLIGSILFIIICFIGIFFIIYHPRRQLFSAFITTTIIPSILVASASACLFAFIGWCFGRYLIISKIFIITGFFIGFFAGITWFREHAVRWDQDMPRIRQILDR